MKPTRVEPEKTKHEPHVSRLTCGPRLGCRDRAGGFRIACRLRTGGRPIRWAKFGACHTQRDGRRSVAWSQGGGSSYCAGSEYTSVLSQVLARLDDIRPRESQALVRGRRQGEAAGRGQVDAGATACEADCDPGTGMLGGHNRNRSVDALRSHLWCPFEAPIGVRFML